MNEPKEVKTSINETILNLENERHSTIISYVASSKALIGPEDTSLLVDAIEQVLDGKNKLPRLDLFLHSPGGFLDAAYKMVRICQEYSNEFNVIIPIAAKSAATVICLGAKSILMTTLAELGPIDPIIQHPYKDEIRVPARSIKDFFDFIGTTEMEGKVVIEDEIKKQMANMLDPYLIGSYQTALLSSKQIAEILLKESRPNLDDDKRKETVSTLTEYYYSHSHVINRNEAEKLGLNIVKIEPNTKLNELVRLLFNIYQHHLFTNNLLKVIGNRDLNRNISNVPLSSEDQQSTGPISLNF